MVAISDFRKGTIALIILGIGSVYFTLYLSMYRENSYLSPSRTGVQHPTTHGHPTSQTKPLSSVRITDFRTSDKLVVFPTEFHESDLKKAYTSTFGDIPKGSKLIRYSYQSQDILSHQFKSVPHNSFNEKGSNFSPYTMTFFNSFTNIESEMDQCSKLENDVEFDVSKSQFLDTTLHDIIKQFRDDNSAYYQEIKPIWGETIDKQLEEGSIDQYWFRLAGSSVWLAQYGVHFMVSRVLYSAEKVRNVPNISFLYIQLFNENWQELTNTELIVPTNDPYRANDPHLDTEDFIHYYKFKAPGFLPVAHYVNDMTRFYGPEDPRILLVKNKLGYEEPLVVFNAFHRKVKGIETDGEGTSKYSFETYRSMFMCWPWQFQFGKKNVDGISNENTDMNLYSRVHELRRKGAERMKTQKNWTPFVSYDDRIQNGEYDSHVYFIYRWINLEILKCDVSDLTFDQPSQCTFAYRMDENLAIDAPVGAMRGGTQMVNVVELLHDTYRNQIDIVEPIIESIPPNREIWIGFARAHLTYCGCGKDMYRPNFAVMIREDDKFKIHTISSFSSFNIEVFGWDMSQPDVSCDDDGPSALIPNGISSWYISTESSKKDGIIDFLTMSFSVSDYTVQIIHLKGVLRALLTLDKKNPNKLFGHGGSVEIGYNDDNINCALEESKHFCSLYGDVFNEKMNPNNNEEEEKKKEEDEKKKEEDEKKKEEDEKKKEEEEKKKEEDEKKKEEDEKKKEEEEKKKEEDEKKNEDEEKKKKEEEEKKKKEEEEKKKKEEDEKKKKEEDETKNKDE
ncbi:beta-mannosyltransferase 4 [[Candida] anglica]|uniref:Beta-mannosyltransferase 4 n=1 Tax=[Candida] anglica TaxID=148631 RepID=A0ABP0EMC7_9ASCO